MPHIKKTQEDSPLKRLKGLGFHSPRTRKLQGLECGLLSVLCLLGSGLESLALAQSSFPPGDALLQAVKKRTEFVDSKASVDSLRDLESRTLGPIWKPDVSLQNRTRGDLDPYFFSELETAKSLTNTTSLDFNWNLYDGGKGSLGQEISVKAVESQNLQLKDQLLKTAENIGTLILDLQLQNELLDLSQKQLEKRKKAFEEVNQQIKRGRRPRQDIAEYEIQLLQIEARVLRISDQMEFLKTSLKRKQGEGLVSLWHSHFSSSSWNSLRPENGNWKVCKVPGAEDLQHTENKSNEGQNPQSLALKKLELQSELLRSRMRLAEVQGTSRPRLDLQFGMGTQVDKEGEWTPNHFLALQFQWKLLERDEQLDSSMKIGKELVLLESQMQLQRLEVTQQHQSACLQLTRASKH